MPQLGLGTAYLPRDKLRDLLAAAIDAGYRAFDTGRVYLNEKRLGEEIRNCDLAREDLFVITKLWQDDQGYDAAFRAYERSVARLGLDYVDLYLIHWPAPGLGKYVDT